MKNYFRYMAGRAGQIVRGSIGLAVLGWGYSKYLYPENVGIMIIGTMILLLAMANILVLAPLFGYPLTGKKIKEKYGVMDGVPGEDPNSKHMRLDTGRKAVL